MTYHGNLDSIMISSALNMSTTSLYNFAPLLFLVFARKCNVHVCGLWKSVLQIDKNRKVWAGPGTQKSNFILWKRQGPKGVSFQLFTQLSYVSLQQKIIANNTWSVYYTLHIYIDYDILCKYVLCYYSPINDEWKM